MTFNSDFNRRFEAHQKAHARMRTFFWIWFAFLFCVWMAIFGTFAYGLYTVVSDPSVIGTFAGEVVKGFQGTK